MKIDFGKIFNDYINEISSLAPKILAGLIIAILFIFLGKIVFKVIVKTTQKKWKNNIMSNFLAEVIKWAIYISGIVIALNAMGFTGIAGTLFAGASVSAIVIGFAFKDIGENLLSGIILAIKRPFEIGDFIEIQGSKGTVKDLDLRSTHLRNPEGKDIYIPNSTIIKNTLINYTNDGLLRFNIPLGIAPECDIELTRKLILNHLKRQETILQDPAPSVIVQELGEFTTNLEVFFWVDILANKKLPEDYLEHSIKSKTITDIKNILDDNNIEMPSQVIEHKMYRKNKFSVNDKIV